MQQPQNVYIIWDYWISGNDYYALYEKGSDRKLYFSEVSFEEVKTLKYKKKTFMGFIKNLFKKKE